MKKVFVFMVGVFFVTSAVAQIPSMKSLRNYNVLCSRLEVQKPPKTDKVFYIPCWKKDSLISLRDEITLSQLNKKWSDSLLIKKQDSIFYFEIQTLVNDSVLVLGDFSKKKPEKARTYYQEQRLIKLQQLFASALVKKDKEEMETVLNTMAYYYQSSELLSGEKSQKASQEAFVVLRNQYAGIMFKCFESQKCTKRDINKLFWYCTDTYPNLAMARGILDDVYAQESRYLFNGGNASQTNFQEAMEYFLAVLYIYNISGVDEKIKSDVIMRGYKKVFELDYYLGQEKRLYQENLRNYLKEKFDVHPDN